MPATCSPHITTTEITISAAFMARSFCRVLGHRGWVLEWDGFALTPGGGMVCLLPGCVPFGERDGQFDVVLPLSWVHYALGASGDQCTGGDLWVI
jgi:hypothetical protein